MLLAFFKKQPEKEKIDLDKKIIRSVALKFIFHLVRFYEFFPLPLLFLFGDTSGVPIGSLHADFYHLLCFTRKSEQAFIHEEKESVVQDICFKTVFDCSFITLITSRCPGNESNLLT